MNMLDESTLILISLKRYTLDGSSLKINITASTDRVTVVNIRFDN